MRQPLDVLVGRLIHHCGALELLVNNSLIQLSYDRILAAEATKAPLVRRIVSLRRLLHDRTDVPDDAIETLCDSLDAIRKKRNMVAHNPIVSAERDPDVPETILVVRYGSEGATKTHEMHREEVADLVTESNVLLRRFIELFPPAATDGKH